MEAVASGGAATIANEDEAAVSTGFATLALLLLLLEEVSVVDP